MSVYDHELKSLQGDGNVLNDLRGTTTLVVNVASRCGLTPQYEQLVALHGRFADRGFTVLGVPCNQFLEQEPGTADEIATFCSTTYGVDFPLSEKIDVNGDTRHPLFADLEATPDADDGHTGDVRWNFEKFLVAGDGSVVARWAPTVVPDDPKILAAIEAQLDT
jgi:glutathione peroxidase